MVDIQSATAEIRRGKKIEDRNHTAKNIMSASATQGGHKKEARLRIKPNSIMYLTVYLEK